MFFVQKLIVEDFSLTGCTCNVVMVLFILCNDQIWVFWVSFSQHWPQIWISFIRNTVTANMECYRQYWGCHTHSTWLQLILQPVACSEELSFVVIGQLLILLNNSAVDFDSFCKRWINSKRCKQRKELPQSQEVLKSWLFDDICCWDGIINSKTVI